MDWNNIISPERTGPDKKLEEIRTAYQKDYDRIIFSSAFRRLQNKTQIFALPGSVFVHNRLTHSLETASVGRSLGKIIGNKLIEKNFINKKNINFYKFELQNVIAAACLTHDIGNPPFGHSGEEALSNYFRQNQDKNIAFCKLKDHYSKPQWYDLINFEGNANSFRILTHKFQGKSDGGFRLTFTTLASMIKYPCSSNVAYGKENKNTIHSKKYSYFQADKDIAVEIMEKLNMKKSPNFPDSFLRHPFVFLTEAADDICYRIVDYEDAHRLNILSFKEIKNDFLELVNCFYPDKNKNKTLKILEKIEDINEKISFLRGKIINFLTLEAADIFINNSEKIIKGEFNEGLIDYMEKKYPILKKIAQVSWDKIYNHTSVIQLEIAGFKVMSDLLSLFLPAVLKPEANNLDEKILYLLPPQFRHNINSKNKYLKTILVLDYLSGMTDPYIIDLYRKLIGIEIPKHN